MRCHCGTHLQHAHEDGLSLWRCPTCGGRAIALADYQHWLMQNPAAPSTPAIDLEALREAPHAKACHRCGRLMGRFRVAARIPFAIDRCATCQALWLDGGEWEALQAEGWATQLANIVTEQWQRELQLADLAARHEQHLRERFGSDAYEQLSRIRDWLAQQELREEMLEYLRQ